MSAICDNGVVKVNLRDFAIDSAPHALVEAIIRLRILREARHQKKSRLSVSIPGVSAVRFQDLAHSDTLFVLGSGSSIHSLHDENFAFMSRHNTLGINYWMAHPFVPSMLLFYLGTVNDYAESHERFRQLFPDRASDYENVVKILMDFNHFHLDFFDEFPASMKANLYIAERFSSFARNEGELSQSIRKLSARNLFRSSNEDRLYKYCASLSTALAIGVRMGVSKIVLCGVDLKDSRYFYHDPVQFPNLQNPSWIPHVDIADPHMTAQRISPRMLNIVQIINVMNRELLIKNGIELFIQHRDSALFPMLPIYSAPGWPQP